MEKENQRYQERKKVGKLKNVEESSQRERRPVRKQWRKNQRNKRKKDKETKILLSLNTPPDSTRQDLSHEQLPQEGRNLEVERKSGKIDRKRTEKLVNYESNLHRRKKMLPDIKKKKKNSTEKK